LLEKVTVRRRWAKRVTWSFGRRLDRAAATTYSTDATLREHRDQAVALCLADTIKLIRIDVVAALALHCRDCCAQRWATFNQTSNARERHNVRWQIEL
jgi:hypothetical protein